MNFWYEIRRVLRSKFIIIVLMIILILTPLISYESAKSTMVSSTGNGGIHFSFPYFISNDTIHIIAYVVNSFGVPLDSQSVLISINNVNYSSSTINGYANFSIPLGSLKNESNILVSYNLGTEYSQDSGVFIINTTQGYSGFSLINGILNPQNSTRLGFIILFYGPHGSPANKFNLSLYAIQKNGPVSSNNNLILEQNYSLSGRNIFYIFPNLNYSQLEKNQMIIIHYGNNTYEEVLGPLTIYSQTSNLLQKNAEIYTMTGVLNFFIALVGIFGGYLTYGKDKTSGILESVLKRPITARKLLAARYSATSIVVILSVLVSGFLSYFIYIEYGQYINISEIIPIFLGVASTGLIYLSISYFFAHIAKSQSTLLASLIVFYIITALFASIFLLILVSEIGGPIGSINYERVYTMASFFFPSEIPGLIVEYETHTVNIFITQSINPYSIGLTPLNITIAILIWIFVPLAFALWRSDKD